MVIAETDRLVLRQFRLDDADAMNGVFGDSEVMRFGDCVRSAGWVQQWIGDCIDRHYPQWGFGAWAVVPRTCGDVIGYCGLTRFPDRCGPGETEMGFRLAREHWGRGYATEAARAVRDHAFAVLRLPRVIAMIDPANTASLRVAEKIGMRYEKDVMLAGYTHPDRLYVTQQEPQESAVGLRHQ